MNYLWIAVIASMLGAMSASAVDQTWTGKISDSMCGAKHNTSAEHGGKVDGRHGAPLTVTGVVRTLSDGRFIHKGPMMRGLPGRLVRYVTGGSVVRCRLFDCGRNFDAVTSTFRFNGDSTVAIANRRGVLGLARRRARRI